MASPSSSKPRNYKFKVFCSFHGPDVRKTFLSHLREQFQGKGITMFDDEKIKRGGDLSPSLKEAIKESRISIVILSQKYASSSWCLDELVEILKRKKAMKQIVMTVFYGVEPSDVRKQTGDFGISFDETCANKTDKERLEWSTALTDVSNIAGEDFKKWDNEANMIKKIARDVSDKLNATPSKDFEDMVGLEAHLREMVSLLDLDYKDEAMIVGISGPAGIGKTTIARALQSLLSDRFELTCFLDLRGSDPSGLHDYGLQLRLQEQLLSKVLNQDGTRICHLGVLQQRLCDLRVLIILDDVNDVKQLKALAKETTWFGLGSRIVVTTENKELLQQRGIVDTYHVGFPSIETTLEIFCKYAFEQSSPPHGFKELAARITHLCGNLPLGLCVMGSSLFGKKQNEWECVMQRLETNPGREIDDVLRVSYERLHENDQMLFLHIAVFFNYKNCDLVEAMLVDDGNLDVKNWLKVLVNKSMIEINHTGEIVMHKLLQQVGRQIIRRQEPWKRQIIINAHEICDVLRYEKGTSNVFGISFDTSGISEVTISDGAFKRLHDLRFLHVYKSRYDGNNRVHISEEAEFPPRLRLLQWDAYPSKCLPPTFNLECLVELNMRESQVEHLWCGTQSLTNLKKMDLSESYHLKELPNLSTATNLQELDVSLCTSLVEIPSSFSHLHKLKMLKMQYCRNLQVIPAHMNLASLEFLYMRGCTSLRNTSIMSTNIKQLSTTVFPPSIRLCSRLTYVGLIGNPKPKGFTHLPKSVTKLDLSHSDIERIPDCIKALHNLLRLYLRHCRRLTSLPELPGSLIYLHATNCESLETVFLPLSNTLGQFHIFTNCIKLGQQARRGIIRRSFCYKKTLLPGTEVPVEFDNRATGSSLTIVLDGNRSYSRFVFCFVISPNQPIPEYLGESEISWHRIIAQDDGYPVEGSIYVGHLNEIRTEHLLIYRFEEFYRPEVNREMMFEFSCKSCYLEIIECGAKIFCYSEIIECGAKIFGYSEIIECGAKILTQEESIEGSYESGSDQAFEDDIDVKPIEEAFEDNTEYGDPTNIDGKKQTDCWSWLFLCFGLSDFCKKRRKLCFKECFAQPVTTIEHSPSYII